jgi:hypothetical protein
MGTFATNDRIRLLGLVFPGLFLLAGFFGNLDFSGQRQFPRLILKLPEQLTSLCF